MSPSQKPGLTAKEKLRPISGFPELLPEERRVELNWIDLFHDKLQAFHTDTFTNQQDIINNTKAHT